MMEKQEQKQQQQHLSGKEVLKQQSLEEKE